MPKTSDAQLRRQLRTAVTAAVAKKALDPVLLDVRQKAGFCDYFLLCHGANPRQIQTIAEAIELALDQAGLRPSYREGGREAEWVVLDYVDFIVHVFSPKTRRFYDLERLWSPAPRLALPAAVRRTLEREAAEQAG